MIFEQKFGIPPIVSIVSKHTYVLSFAFILYKTTTLYMWENLLCSSNFDYYTTTSLPPQKHLCTLSSAVFIDSFFQNIFFLNG